MMKPLLSLVGLLLLSNVSFLFAASHEKGAEPLVISHGEEIMLNDYVVTGKTTVFDFSSEYCPPCRAIAPKLTQLHQDRADIAVVRIDINRPDVKKIDWSSPVAKQYNLRSIPHFKIYDQHGSLVAEGDSAYQMVRGWLEKK